MKEQKPRTLQEMQERQEQNAKIILASLDAINNQLKNLHQSIKHFSKAYQQK